MCDSDDRDARREARLRQLGTRTPRCIDCGESDPFALTLTPDGLRCYECQALAAGRPWTERHHPAGRHNHPTTVAIPGNDHRVVDDHKTDWPRDTLRNPDGSPLLRAAGCLRGWLDTLRVIMDRTVGWIPPFLEQLDRWLTDLLGRGWWHQMPAADLS
jgi:hypothetical protein